MDIITVVLATCVILLTFLYTKTRRPSNYPPGPPTVPFIGNLLLDMRDLMGVYRRYRKQYGDIFSLILGKQTLVVVNGTEAAHEVFVKHGDVTSGRPDVFFFRDVGGTSGVGSSSGQKWKEARSCMLGALRDQGMGKKSMEFRILEEVEEFLGKIGQYQEKPFDITDICHVSIANVTLSVTFGRRYDYSDEKFTRLLLSVAEIFKNPDTFGLTMFLPFLMHLPGDPLGTKEIMKWQSKIAEHCREEMVAHKESFDENNIRDILDAFIHRQRTESGEYRVFTDHMIEHVCLDLFMAGTDTTATILRWFVVFIIQNPDVQKRMREEIFNVIGSERKVSYHDRSSLPFCEAVTHETLRLGNIGPYGLPHLATDDVILKDFIIPKGAIIIPSLDSVNNDPHIFKTPEKFDPCRFLDKNENIYGTNRSIPFSTGRRVCVGESLARMEIFLFTTNLIQTFELLPETDDKPLETKGILGIVNAPTRFKCRACRVEYNK